MSVKIIIFSTLLLTTFSWSHGFLEEYLRSDDLAIYSDFVNKIEAKLKSNCVNDFPMTNFQRKFTAQSTLRDMWKIMCEYDNVDNSTDEFPWKMIIEKLDYLDMQAREYNFELMHLMKKIGKYWVEIDKIARIADFDNSILSFGCDDLGRYFQWKINVDAELCNGDINSIYARFITAIKNKMKKYAGKLNICDVKETLQNEMTAFYKQGMKAHIQRYVLTSYELSVTFQCADSCVNAELDELKELFLKNMNDFKGLMFKTMEDFAAYIKKCDIPRTTRPPCDNWIITYYPCPPQPDNNNNYIPRTKRPPINPCVPNGNIPYPCALKPDNNNNNNYIELERAYQIKIVNEKEISKSKSCSHNCDLSKISDVNAAEECQGYTECRYVSNKFDVCEANDGKRRYDWIKDGNDIVYGTGGACYGKTKSYSSLGNWYYSSMDSCDYCICTCVSKPKHDPHTLTAISFREQLSDFHNERVVVGVRFVRKDYMVHLQIAEAKLLPYGKVDPSTFAWKALENFEFSESEQKFYIKADYGGMKALSLGKDYGRPSVVNLDDVMGNNNEVVTGVRFRYAGDNPDCPVKQIGSIELQIQVRRFEFSDGHVSEFYKPKWISAGNKERYELFLQEPDNPLKAPFNNELSSTNQFIRFQASDFRKDAGQSTVPFLDALDVTTTPLVPLRGVGIFHRGHKGFGGFLTLKVYDLDSRFYSVVNVNAGSSGGSDGFDGLDNRPFFKFLGNIVKLPGKMMHDFWKNMNRKNF